jgi:hypothetical protein
MTIKVEKWGEWARLRYALHTLKRPFKQNRGAMPRSSMISGCKLRPRG